MDYPLLFAALALSALGLVMVASASITLADRELGQPFYYALRQAIYIGAGVLVGRACIACASRWWSRPACCCW